MHFVKQFVRKGGRSFEKTAMKQYDQCESAITVNAFNNFLVDGEEKDKFFLSMNEDFNRLEYDSNKFYLFYKNKLQKNCSFSQVEANYLLDCLLSEVYKVSPNYEDAYEKSSFFRLHSYYKNLLGLQKQFILFDGSVKIISFKDFLIAIYNKQYTQGNKNICLHINNSYVVLSDDEISTVSSIFLLLAYQKKFNIYKKAIIYGLRFTARGIECIETENATADNYSNYGKQGNFYEMNNIKNNISLIVNWSSQYSSWCRYKINKLQFDEDLNPSFMYGQLNYFFRFHCETDKILHGLPIANLVPRNFVGANTIQNPLGVDKIPCERLFNIPRRRNDDRNWFIPLTNISPTAILSVPFDDQAKPIYIKNDIISPEEKSFYSDTNKISYMLVFDLHPNRKYSTFDLSKLKRYNKFSSKELNNFEIDDDADNDEEESSNEEESNNEEEVISDEEEVGDYNDAEEIDNNDNNRY
jgi:hypothetical protein